MDLGRVLRRRASVLAAIRRWFDERGFLEVDVPVRVASGAMEEHLHALPLAGGWLHTSPEFALKRAMAAGLHRVYAVTPCFRAEEAGPHHGLEFTMVEWYRAGTDQEGAEEDLLGVVAAAAEAAGTTLPPVRRTTWKAAWRAAHGSPPPEDSVEVFRGWVERVEPALGGLVVVRDYPAWQAAGAALRGAVAERFELYWDGLELANAATELRDPRAWEARWREANRRREAAGRPPHPVDPRVVEAVGRLPRCGGVALGFDRLLLRLLGAREIQAVRLPA